MPQRFFRQGRSESRLGGRRQADPGVANIFLDSSTLQRRGVCAPPRQPDQWSVDTQARKVYRVPHNRARARKLDRIQGGT